MVANRRSSERSGAQLRNVYVARTVKEPQKSFERFLNTFGRHLGRTAAINTIGSTHLTFLESTGVRAQFQARGYSPRDIRAFKAELEIHLHDPTRKDDFPVNVDPRRPFVWLGRYHNSLALNIVLNEELQAERNEIEDFLVDRFGRLPRLRSFDTHIKLGRVDLHSLSLEEQRYPETLVPSHVFMPELVALNGLEVFLDRIQPDSRVPCR